jgi:hypothetical protein
MYEYQKDSRLLLARERVEQLARDARSSPGSRARSRKRRRLALAGLPLRRAKAQAQLSSNA